MTDRTSPTYTGGQHPYMGIDSTKNRKSFATDPRIHGNTETKIEQVVDIPDRFESFLLAEGEKKVEHEPETRQLYLAVAP